MARRRLAITQKIQRGAQLTNEEMTCEACWLWGKARTKEELPVFKHNGRTQSVRRVAYEELHGPLPRAVKVRQTCGNILCVNPHHAATDAEIWKAEPCEPEEMDDELTVDDVVDCILQTDQREASALGAKYGVPRALVDRALEVIRRDGL